MLFIVGSFVLFGLVIAIEAFSIWRLKHAVDAARAESEKEA